MLMAKGGSVANFPWRCESSIHSK